LLKKGLNGVPCNGCRMCCYHLRIEVEPQDDIRHLDIETHEDGGQTLRRREDGSCVHLGPEGCTVYAHRPRGCRTYDCRLFSLLGIVETAVPVPHWTFSARTREEKAVLFALHMTVVEHSRGGRVTHEVLQDIITGYEEHLPFAREMVTNMERMTTAEREAFITGNSSRDSAKLEPFLKWACVSLASEQILPDLINPQGWCSSRRWGHCCFHKSSTDRQDCLSL
jgi:hypothetical protein